MAWFGLLNWTRTVDDVGRNKRRTKYEQRLLLAVDWLDRFRPGRLPYTRKPNDTVGVLAATAAAAADVDWIRLNRQVGGPTSNVSARININTSKLQLCVLVASDLFWSVAMLP